MRELPRSRAPRDWLSVVRTGSDLRRVHAPILGVAETAHPTPEGLGLLRGRYEMGEDAMRVIYDPDPEAPRSVQRLFTKAVRHWAALHPGLERPSAAPRKHWYPRIFELRVSWGHKGVTQVICARLDSLQLQDALYPESVLDLWLDEIWRKCEREASCLTGS